MALVPQAEELDENNMQVASPGFHVIFLPFAEDFRTLHFEESPKGVLVALSWCTNMHVCVWELYVHYNYRMPWYCKSILVLEVLVCIYM